MSTRKFLCVTSSLMCAPLLGTAQVDLNNGLLASYPFNGNANDESGNGHHGNVVGPTLTTDRNGVPDAAYDFNENFIRVPDSPLLTTPAMSISMWMAPNATTDVQMALGKTNIETAFGEQYAVAIDPPNWTIRYAVKQGSNCSPGAGWQQVVAPAPVVMGEWTHVVVAFENSVHRIYRNGTLVSDSVLALPDIDVCPGGDLQFGAWYQGGFQYFNGKLDDIRLYNRAINVDEVQALFSGATSIADRAAPNITIAPNPASGQFSLRAVGNGIESVLLFDPTGHPLQADISLDAFGAHVGSNYVGVAMVRVRTAQGVSVSKVQLE